LAESVPAVEPVPETFAATVGAALVPPEPVAASKDVAETEDLLGLENIFKDDAKTAGVATMTEQDIDRIADRVIQRLSTKIIESIAWDVVPDITEKIVREELKRNR